MPEQVYEQHRLLKKVVSLQLRIARRTNRTVALLESEHSFCPGLVLTGLDPSIEFKPESLKGGVRAANQKILAKT